MVVVGLACVQAGFDSINKDVVVKSCDRTVDMTTQLVKLQHKMVIENQGKGAVKSILFSVDPELKDKVAFIGATFGGSEKTYLRVSETKVQSDLDKPFWKIELKSSLSAGASTTISVEVVLGGALEMFPAAISQKEKQLVRYTGNLYIYLPYSITTQTTTVQLASSSLESYTKTKPVSLSDSTITYGPYNNIAPFSVGEMVIHGENNSPMLVVSRLERVIEVSMWGNIAIEETIDVVHKGAALKGSFSRYEFQRENSGVSSVKNFKTLLPAAAKDVYYRDDIGNISTSHMKVMDDAVELDLRPRFPLFGGWKTHYVTGYNVPSYEYIFYKGDQHVLNMRLIDHIFDDMLVEEVEVRVILPEGVTNVELSTPYSMTRGEDTLHYTYLDTTGRTVVSLYSSKLLTESHIQDFQLGFSYPHRNMMAEPLILVAAFFLLYLMAIIYVRLDFSITKDEASESRMRVASLIEEVQTVQDRRSALYQSYEDAINKYKASKDTTSFATNRKRINNDHMQISTQITGLQAKLKAEGADVVEKVGELQRLDTQVREQINLGIQAAERLVAGKMSKQQYVDYEATVKSKRDEVLVKLDQLLTSL